MALKSFIHVYRLTMTVLCVLKYLKMQQEIKEENGYISIFTQHRNLPNIITEYR